MEVSGQLHAQTATSSGKDPPGSRWKGDWVGPKANLYTVVVVESLVKLIWSTTLCIICIIRTKLRK